MLAFSLKAGKVRSIYLTEDQIAVTDRRTLNEQYEVEIRVFDKAGSNWECGSEIINRLCDKPVRRVYGWGRNKATAEDEVELEADRRMRRTGMAR